MSKTITMALADVLSDLSREHFKHFCMELRDRREEPRIRRIKVDGKDHLEITDMMVSTFTEEGARDVAIGILDRMDCKALAKRLAEETGGTLPIPGSGNTGAVAGFATPGSAAAPASSVDRYTQFLDNHRLALIRRVTNVDSILDHLLHRRVISQEIYNSINALATNQAKIRAIFNGPLMAGGMCKQIFYEILEEEEPYLMTELKSL